MKVNCNYFQVFASGQQQPVGGVGTCQAHDPDGDCSVKQWCFPTRRHNCGHNLQEQGSGQLLLELSFKAKLGIH